MSQTNKRVLISVSDKAGIANFAKDLTEKGFTIVSSGGTYRHLSEAGLSPVKVSQVTGFPEILDGRVKTLHPHIHGALLARYELPSHRRQLDDLEIQPFQAVVVNLYPFVKTIAREDATVDEAIEQIDIGGPTMVRATAKNFKNLTILTDPEDYADFLAEVDENGLPSLAFRLKMAQKAFQHTFSYDMHIANYLDGARVEEDRVVHGPGETLPPFLRLNARQDQSLRYGENPHQEAASYLLEGQDSKTFITQHQGKQLSFNNLVDMESAWHCACDFQAPTAVIVKHTNPCGVGTGDVLEAAFRRARKVDPTSAFGGVIAFNREVDGDTAKAINEAFAELVIAPAFSEAALKRFRRKKNLRVLQLPLPASESTAGFDIKRLDHGLMLQSKDRKRVSFEQWQCVSERQPDESQIKALTMAWTLVAHVKSNAIVYADPEGAVGIGAGQMSRVDSAKIAISKAGEAGMSVAGTAMASDAFFPFRDSIDAAAAAGVTAVVEPGGSIRDDEVIQAANEHGISLFFTGTRHFKH